MQKSALLFIIIVVALVLATGGFYAYKTLQELQPPSETTNSETAHPKEEPALPSPLVERGQTPKQNSQKSQALVPTQNVAPKPTDTNRQEQKPLTTPFNNSGGTETTFSPERKLPVPVNNLSAKLRHNVFILEDDGALVPDAATLTKKFYEKHPDQYDFLGFHYKNVVVGGYTYSYQAQYVAQGGFMSPHNSTALYGSGGNLLGGYVDSFSFNKVYVERDPDNSPISHLDSYYFGLLFHELTHYWGVSGLANKLREALRDPFHFEFFTRSWVSVNTTTRAGLVEGPPGKYYFKVDCTAEPKHHDFDLYGMGLKSYQEVREKLVVMAKTGVAPTLECDTDTEVPADFIRKSYTIQDFINVLGPRIPSAENSQKDFTIAFVLVIPKGSELTKKEVDALNWIADKFPIAWYRSTERRSTLNNIRLQDFNPPIISNVKTTSTGSSIEASWTTSKPATSFIIYTEKEVGISRIFPYILTMPPKFGTSHQLIIQSNHWTPIKPDTEYKVKIISIDENFNLASFDVGTIQN